MEQIRTQRLTLDPLAVSDANEMATVLADVSLYRFIGGEPPSTSDLEELYRFQVGGSPREGETWHNWVVRAEGAAAGYVQATVIAGEADLAWVIGVPWQGQGYATEAARAMRDWLVSTGVTRFTAHIHADHGASGSVAEALDLTSTGATDESGEIIWESSTRDG